MLCVGVLAFIFAKQSGQVLEYNTALLSVCFAILLGLADDIMDIRWKYKLSLGEDVLNAGCVFMLSSGSCLCIWFIENIGLRRSR